MFTILKFQFVPYCPKINAPKSTILPSRVFAATSKNSIFRLRNSFSQTAPPIWTASEIAEAINGTIVNVGPPGTISTDTRTIQPGQWFFAITGENFDAHDFVTLDLQEMGCVGVIGNRVCKNWENGFIKVEGNTLISLKKLAIFARTRFCGCLIGVTGSVGKTTTKSMIALALGSVGVVYQSHGNWNNEIGVALSLIGIPRYVDFVVLELGMSGQGEILELSRLCQPSVRVILNVGASHLENFKSLEEVSLAKAEILREAKAGHICILNADDPLLVNLSVPLGVKKVLFGKEVDCGMQLVSARSIDGGLGVRVVLKCDKEMVEFEISSPGLHLALNACAAAAVVSCLGVSLAQIGTSLSSYAPVHMRSELEVSRSGIIIINDSYNSSPASTRAAIELLKGLDCKGKKVCILGDMLELGPTEIKFHEMVLEYCCAHFNVIALVGKRFLVAVDNLNLIDKTNIVHAYNSKDLACDIVKMLKPDDVVLVKGSRAMQMDKIVTSIKSMHNVISN